jgi:sortase (surface protein transpeptidase)
VAVVAACGSDDGADSIAGDGDIDWTTPSTRPEPEEPAEEDADTESVAEQSETPSEASTADTVSGLYNLEIPQLGVTAPVVAIASAERVLLPPRDPGVVGWWSQGAAPGDDRGTAILTGHSLSSGGGALDDITDLSPGNEIQLSNGLTYRVDSVEVLSYDAVREQAETLFDQSVEGGRLVLVTCEDWDGSTWSSNVITIATPA